MTPPANQGQANAMIADHRHLAGELVELRRLIAKGETDAALAVTDRVVEGLTKHLAHEEQLLDRVATGQGG